MLALNMAKLSTEEITDNRIVLKTKNKQPWNQDNGKLELGHGGKVESKYSETQ